MNAVLSPKAQARDRAGTKSAMEALPMLMILLSALMIKPIGRRRKQQCLLESIRDKLKDEIWPNRTRFDDKEHQCEWIRKLQKLIQHNEWLIGSEFCEENDGKDTNKSDFSSLFFQHSRMLVQTSAT